MKHYIPGW